MLTLLFPGALWTLVALSLPVALHLWRQPPRTVLLGSLRFLRAHAGRCWRNLRWREHWLLAARLALLAFLALLLAKPLWRQVPSRAPQHWALIDPEAALSRPALTRLRELQKAGVVIHRLTTGLPVITQFTGDVADAPGDVWSLLREADTVLPVGSSLTIFSPARFASLRGLRPTLRSKAEWVETPDEADSKPEVWLDSVRAATAPGKPPIVMVGMSDADHTGFAPNPPTGWKLETNGNTARLLGPADRAISWPFLAAPKSISALILHDPDRAQDARFLAAAIHAATTGGGVLTNVADELTSSDLVAQPAMDWTFWLSAAPAPATVKNRVTHLFEDVHDAGAEHAGCIVPGSNVPGSEFLISPARLWRSGSPPAGAMIWTDEHGAPLLTRTPNEHGPRWHFAARFHPDWTDLPRTSALPAFVRTLLWPQSPLDARHDLRRAASSQAQPFFSPATDFSREAMQPPDGGKTIDLHGPLWALAAGLFCLERVLAHLRPTIPSKIQTPASVAAFVR